MTELHDGPVAFDKVFAAERVHIKSRRVRNGRPNLAQDPRSGELTGLSLSGGGIRSAAVCLGAIQALQVADALPEFDYLSTVSGGGYTGACLNASMSEKGGFQYPFGEDVEDSPVVAHLRNFSNYLLPRNRSAIRNSLEALVVLLRGWLANAVCVLSGMIPIVLALVIAYPNPAALLDPNVILRFANGMRAIANGEWISGNTLPLNSPAAMLLPLIGWGLLTLVLTLWAMLKSRPQLDNETNDTRSGLLRISYVLLITAILLTVIDLQPLAMAGLFKFGGLIQDPGRLKVLVTGLSTSAALIATFAGRVARFVETSGRSKRKSTSTLRFLSRLLLVVGALVLPTLIWITGDLLYLWILKEPNFALRFGLSFAPKSRFDVALWAWFGTIVISAGLRPNNYSLHWLYRDRLSAAFLVSPIEKGPSAPTARGVDPGINPLNRLKLSELKKSVGPYPIINCALNLQGSLEANKRGRNADFFVFTPEYVGSELTGYVRTTSIEDMDGRIDVGAAMAISGAAASANMGSSTIRILSPTLTLMNVRLGYYLKNPRYVGEAKTPRVRLEAALQRLRDLLFLVIEMVNGLNEHRRTIYLSDGGHIENLGIYELLRRRCGFVLAIDSEADPELGFGSFLKLERYARIDLGIRIILPWESIARQSRQISDAIARGDVPCEMGPHCAVGKIIYPDGPPGLLVYVKSSLSGDERDYILDYARRNGTFPHESTSDQFFSEEQFEIYRALGFHMIQGVFGSDRISYIEGPDGFANDAAARAAINAHLARRVL